jgi:hypothetical protein
MSVGRTVLAVGDHRLTVPPRRGACAATDDGLQVYGALAAS